MNDRNLEESQARPTPSSAADWYVQLDGGLDGDIDDLKLAEWMAADRESAAAFVRSEASAFLTAKLREQGRLSWAFEEAAAIAGASTEAPSRPVTASWAHRPALAWSIAALSLAFALATLVTRSPTEPAAPIVVANDRPVEASADEALFESPVYVLPGNVFVDPRSVAVLPFTNQDASEVDDGLDTHALANQIYADVLRSLESIPGMYVVGSAAVAPYANGAVSALDIATQLGVRSIVDGRIETDAGRLQVFISVIDVASNAQLIDNTFERPISELGLIDIDIASDIAFALESSAPLGIVDRP
jgi:TolB-like protein